MIVSEYVLLLMPERFWLWYSVMIPVLLLMRYPDYRQRKWLFFYLDFCYYVQVERCYRHRVIVVSVACLKRGLVEGVRNDVRVHQRPCVWSGYPTLRLSRHCFWGAL